MTELELLKALTRIKDETSDPKTAKQLAELMYERWGKSAQQS